MSGTLSLLDLLPTQCWAGQVPPKPPTPPKRAYAKRHRTRTYAPRGMADLERQASLVRGVLIKRLDDWAAADGRAGADRYGLTGEEFLRFYGDMLASLFREEFDDGPPVAYADAGLIPHAGHLHRVKASWFKAFAESVGAIYQAAAKPAPRPDVAVAGVMLPAGEKKVLDDRRERLGRAAG